MTEQELARPDRVVFLSHADYVDVLDHHPQILKDDRIVVVPSPLIGSWVADQEIAAVESAPNTVLLRDAGSDKLVPAESALRTLALSRVYAFIEVCQLLGATSLRTTELDESTMNAHTTNQFGAGSTDPVTSKGSTILGVTADFAAGLRREVRSRIEAVGTFAGSAPDVPAAEAVVARYEDLSQALGSLIKLRSARANTMRRLEVRVDFLSATHSEMDLLLGFDQGLGTALGRNSQLGLVARLRNQFHRDSDATRHQTMSIEVVFPEH
ncbi:hypothetical protein [Actinophytocola glycyrrhizae]|uniref:Uncharacterized protein n=1 Tax=Actinophytocola glycyrrhizae TaxID=2044873 RepID=A0ABV9S6C4_9PSEU